VHVWSLLCFSPGLLNVQPCLFGNLHTSGERSMSLCFTVLLCLSPGLLNVQPCLFGDLHMSVDRSMSLCALLCCCTWVQACKRLCNRSVVGVMFPNKQNHTAYTRLSKEVGSQVMAFGSGSRLH
jgi:hypothetical protein